MGEILGMLVTGLIVGALARLALPGSDPIGCVGTIAVGVIGGVIGGLLGQQIVGDFEERGLLFLVFSVLGAVLILLVLRAFSGRRRF